MRIKSLLKPVVAVAAAAGSSLALASGEPSTSMPAVDVTPITTWLNDFAPTLLGVGFAAIAIFGGVKAVGWIKSMIR